MMDSLSTDGGNNLNKQRNDAYVNLGISDSDSSSSDRSSTEHLGAFTEDDESTVYTNSVGNSTEGSERKMSERKYGDSNESDFNLRKVIGKMFACGNDQGSVEEAITLDDDRSIFSVSSKYSTYSKKVKKTIDYDTSINSNYNDSGVCQTKPSQSRDDTVRSADSNKMTDDDTFGEDGNEHREVEEKLKNQFIKEGEKDEREIFDSTKSQLKDNEEDVNVDADMENKKNNKNAEDCNDKDELICNEDIFKDMPHYEIDFDKGQSILYRAIDTRSWKKAYKILRKSPEEASTWVFRRDENSYECKWMFLPIHVACFSGAPLGLIVRLVRACPQVLRMGANGGKVPFHIACETLADSSVITFLHSVYPEALYAIDEAGNTPLQEVMFCSRTSGRARVMKLLTALTEKDCLSDDRSDDENILPNNEAVSKLNRSEKKMRDLRRPIVIKKGIQSCL